MPTVYYCVIYGRLCKSRLRRIIYCTKTFFSFLSPYWHFCYSSAKLHDGLFLLYINTEMCTLWYWDSDVSGMFCWNEILSGKNSPAAFLICSTEKKNDEILCFNFTSWKTVILHLIVAENISVILNQRTKLTDYVRNVNIKAMWVERILLFNSLLSLYMLDTVTFIFWM